MKLRVRDVHIMKIIMDKYSAGVPKANLNMSDSSEPKSHKTENLQARSQDVSASPLVNDDIQTSVMTAANCKWDVTWRVSKNLANVPKTRKLNKSGHPSCPGLDPGQDIFLCSFQ